MKLLRARHAQRQQTYYQEKPSHDPGQFQGSPSNLRTVFEQPPNPNGIITRDDGIYDLLKEPTLVIEREIDFSNVIFGFEPQTRYKIMDSFGRQLGYMEEVGFGLMKAIGRQFYRLHRPFTINVYDNLGEIILRIKRPFSIINSHITCLLPGIDADGKLMFETVGSSRQQWHLWRRRYNLFKLEDDHSDAFEQFGAIDAPFLAYDFAVKNEAGDVIGGVDRNWVGLGRELFTNAGVYIVRMDPASFAGLGHLYPSVAGPLTLDQRAILLATAVSIDFDFFSRRSKGGGTLFYTE